METHFAGRVKGPCQILRPALMRAQDFTWLEENTAMLAIVYLVVGPHDPICEFIQSTRLIKTAPGHSPVQGIVSSSWKIQDHRLPRCSQVL